MKYNLLVIIFCFLSGLSFSQQSDIARVISLPLVNNPAYAGSYNQYKVDLSYLYQWLGTNDSPEILQGSFEIPVSAINSGVGVFLSSYKSGIVTNNVANLSYSYHLKLNEINIQIGSGLNFNRYKVNFGDYIFYTEPDPLIEAYEKDDSRLSLVNGIYIYTNKFYLSMAYQDILLYASDEGLDENLKNLDLVFGYHFFKENNFSFCPSLIINYDFEVLQIPGINLTATLYDKFWLGSTYYHENDLLDIAAGINIWKCYGSIRYRNYVSGNLISSNFFDNGLYEISTGFYFNKK